MKRFMAIRVQVARTPTISDITRECAQNASDSPISIAVNAQVTREAASPRSPCHRPMQIGINAVGTKHNHKKKRSRAFRLSARY
jgi:hypothetical protein